MGPWSLYRRRRRSGRLEYLLETHGLIVAAGWTTDPDFRLDEDTFVARYVRPDVSASQQLPKRLHAGFVAVRQAVDSARIHADSGRELRQFQQDLGVRGVGGRPVDKVSLGVQGIGTGAFLLHKFDSELAPQDHMPEWLSSVLQEIRTAEGESAHPFATRNEFCVDFAFFVPQAQRLLLYGWARAGARISVRDVEGERNWVQCRSMNFDRADLFGAMGEGFLGFVAVTPWASVDGGRVLVRTSSSSELERQIVSVVTLDDHRPIAIASALFEVQTPARDFVRRLAVGEGALFRDLLSAKMASGSGATILLDHGAPAPILSIVVPLFRRYDMLWNQFSRWSQAEIADDCEFVLVNDDPQSVDGVYELVVRINSIYGLNVRLLSNCENGGFARACNLGARHSRSSRLLFLNSDAYLDDLDSVRSSLQLLDGTDEVGLIGAVIVRPDGLVDHAGMQCVYLEERGSWFNYHPHEGWRVADLPDQEFWPSPAVTGAVMLMRSEDFVSVGGFHEGFLIGDYEDSDLCWKVRDLGKTIMVSSQLRARHMARTSMSLIGSAELRAKISMLNSWIHMDRWRAGLEQDFNSAQAVD